MAGWQTQSSEVVYETAWIKVRRDEVLTQTGKPLTYSYMELQSPSVFVVALNDKQEVFLQRVYRHTLGQRLWEIPAGYSNKEEDLLAAAKRELQEETGLTSTDWHDLGRIYQVAGVGRVPAQLFLAQNVTQASQPTDEDEDIIDRQFFTPAKIEDMIRNGELIDSPVIAALYVAKLYQRRQR